MNTTSFKLYQSINRLIIKSSNGERWADGEIVTKLGIVSVASKCGKYPYTKLDFVHKGRLYTRIYEVGFSTHALSRRANSFAREITEQKE